MLLVMASASASSPVVGVGEDIDETQADTAVVDIDEVVGYEYLDG